MTYRVATTDTSLVGNGTTSSRSICDKEVERTVCALRMRVREQCATERLRELRHEKREARRHKEIAADADECLQRLVLLRVIHATAQINLAACCCLGRGKYGHAMQRSTRRAEGKTTRASP